MVFPRKTVMERIQVIQNIFRMTSGTNFGRGWLWWPGHPCRESGAACLAAPGVHAGAATSPVYPCNSEN